MARARHHVLRHLEGRGGPGPHGALGHAAPPRAEPRRRRAQPSLLPRGEDPLKIWLFAPFDGFLCLFAPFMNYRNIG